MASASGYNHQRFARAVLKKSRKWEPSLTVQLFPNHFRFENSPSLFPYDGPMKPFLLALRSQVIPAILIKFLYSIKPPISFVDGCLVVEIQDFRKTPEVRSRVVMRPAAETMAQTIEVMLQRRGEVWDEQMALELESRIISATSPPLYLGTSILATRNALLSLSLTSPASPHTTSTGQPRSLNPTTSDTPLSDLETTRKLIKAGERSVGSSTGGGGFQPNWSVLRVKERMDSIARIREKEAARLRGEMGDGDAGSINGNGNGSINGNNMGNLANGEGGNGVEKKKSKKKRQLEEDISPEDKKKKKRDEVDDGVVKKKKKKKDGMEEGEKGRKVKIKKRDEDD